MTDVIARKEKEDPYDRGKIEPATKEELAARQEMFDDQARYDKLFFEMQHPKGKNPKEMEAYISSKREDLEDAKKKWNKSINKHGRLRAGRR